MATFAVSWTNGNADLLPPLPALVSEAGELTTWNITSADTPAGTLSGVPLAINILKYRGFTSTRIVGYPTPDARFSSKDSPTTGCATANTLAIDTSDLGGRAWMVELIRTDTNAVIARRAWEIGGASSNPAVPTGPALPNTVFAGPVSGTNSGNGAFRFLVAADMPGDLAAIAADITGTATGFLQRHSNGTYTLSSSSGGGTVNTITAADGTITIGGTATDPTVRVASGQFDASGAAAAAQAASQPLDSDLTAIAALSTTTFGRALLTTVDAAGGRTTFGLGTASTHAATDFDASGAAAAVASSLSSYLTSATAATTYAPNGTVLIYHADPTIAPTSYKAASNTDAARGTAIVTAFAALAAGEKIVVGLGDYAITSLLTFPSNVTIEGMGYGSHIYQANGQNLTAGGGAATSGLLMNVSPTGNTNIAIRGLRLDGNNSNNDQHLGPLNGVSLNFCTGCVVEHCWIEHLGNSGVNSCMGIAPMSCTDCHFTGNTITDTVDGINPFWDLTTPCQRLTIADNIINSTNRDYGINLFHTNYSTVTGNVIRSNDSNIRIRQSNFNTISNNVCASSATEHGVFVDASAAGNIISGNQITGSFQYGIRVVAAAGDYNVVSNNYCLGAGGTADIFIEKATTIQGPNVVTGVAQTWTAPGALSIASTGTMTVQGNTITAGTGTLTLGSFTVTAAKTGTIAMLSDLVGYENIKGLEDCSANPNYPAGAAGDTYYVSVAGKIGGASGKSVLAGDVFICVIANAGGTQASVGADWVVLNRELGYVPLNPANNLSDLANAGTARTNLGGTTVGGNVFTLTNPSAVSFITINADNTVTARSAANFKADLSLGNVENTALSTSNANVGVVGLTIDGGGSAITTGVRGYIRVPYGGTWTEVSIVGDQTGSIVIDVWKLAFSTSALPTVANTITASDIPTISAAKGVVDSTLTGWTTSFSAGDVIAFNVNSCTSITRATIVLKSKKS